MAGRTLDQSAVGGVSNPPSQARIMLGIAAIIATAIAIDLVTPHEFSAGLFLNYFAIFLSSRLKAPRASFGIMAIVSVLAIIGFYVKSDGHTDIHLANLLVTVSILWMMAAFTQRRVVKERESIDQRAAIESANRFRDLFDNARLGIQLADLDGRRLMVNKVLADLLGYGSEAELMAVPLQNIIAPHDRDRAMRECPASC